MSSHAIVPPYAVPSFHNPFAEPVAAAAPTDVAADAPEGSYTYALVQSGPEVSREECEVAAGAVEVKILWAATVLHVAHLSPPGSFYLGETGDYLIPEEKLGASRAPLVIADDAGAVRVVLLPGATVTMTIAGAAISTEEARRRGMIRPCVALGGADELLLPGGASVTLERSGFRYEIAAVKAGRAHFGHAPVASQSLASAGVSALVHLSLLGALAMFAAPLGASDESVTAEDQLYRIRQSLEAAAEKETRQLAELAAGGAADEPVSRAADRPSPGASGAPGAPTSRTARGRVAVMGPEKNDSPRLARSEVLAMASRFGMIEYLRGDPDAPTSRWGEDTSLGRDALSARGNMWTGDVHEASGPGGLSLSGDGDGSDGDFKFIGLPGIRTMGTDDARTMLTRGPRGLRGDHKATGPLVGTAPPHVQGVIAPELIQRTVRQNFGRFRACYETGLRGNPALAGRVAVRFVIGRDGAVSSVGSGGSDLADPGVVSCVTRAFYGLSFSPPESGIVTVVYPIMFSPG
jgi:hypothetical protein